MKLSLNTSGLPLQDLVFGASVYFPPLFKAVLLGFFIWLFLHRQLRDWMYAGDIWHPLLMDLSLFALSVCLAWYCSLPGDLPVMKRLKYLSTLLVAAVALIAAWLLWNFYTQSPWTRDGKVRAEQVGITPQVSGSILQLNVTDNQRVKAGEVLFTIDDTPIASRC